MLQIQRSYIDFVIKTNEMAKSLKCTLKYSESLNELKEKLEEQELIVPVIGGFSSGKSSLINSFLGSKILGVKITPETAIATELRYSTDEKIEAIKDNGECQSFSINELDEISQNAQNYNHLKLYLNNEKLKNIEPIVLVDMPGFNAPVATHNKAIERYMPRGVFFVALLSASDEKTLQTSLISQLDSIAKANKEFGFAISKANLVSDEDLQGIENMLKNQLITRYSYDKNIEKLEKNSGAILEDILKNIDTKRIFEKIYKPSLELVKLDLISSINTQLTTLRNDKKQSEQMLVELESNKIKIKAEQEKIKANMEQKYSSTNIEGIISSIDTALRNNASSLALSVLRGGDLQKEVSNIINSILPNELQSRLNGISKSVIDSYNLSISNINIDLGMTAWADSLKEFVQSACFTLSDELKNKEQHSLNNALLSSSIGSLGSAAAMQALSKLGFAINPVVGGILSIVLGILPGFVSSFLDNKKEDIVKDKIIAEVIPSIITQIRPKLNEFFNSQVSQMINNVASAFDEKISNQELEIKNSLEEKEKNIKDVEAQIANLEGIREQINNLAKEHLGA